MNWNDAIFQLIDLRTFSSVWYWLAVAVTWSTVCHWIIGVPFDLIYRARRDGGQAAMDLDLIVDINVRRLMTISDMAGASLTAVAAFVIAALASMGFYYGFELAQGFFLLALPLTLVGMISMRRSRRYAIGRPTGKELALELMKLRFWIQVLAVGAIFVTAMYGMYYNVSTMPLL